MQSPFRPEAFTHARPRMSSVHSSAVAHIAEEDERADNEQTQQQPASPQHQHQLPQWSDSDTTPRASVVGAGGALGLLSMPDLCYPRRPLSRDDTANDMHILAALSASNTSENSLSALVPAQRPLSGFGTTEDRLNALSGEERLAHFRASRRSRRTPTRLPSQSSSSSTATSTDADLAPGETKTASLGRRFSRNYKERMHELRESMHRYAIPVVSSRARRSSTPQQLHLADNPDDFFVSPTSPMRPPNSPPKRSARPNEERPRKLRSTFFALGDRKDTPAPPAFGLPVRPASSKTGSTVISAPGGDGARKAAALHNHQPSSGALSPMSWALSDDDDLNVRRRRLGSLSSAADSGADLSTYSGSEAGVRDQDGDVNMSSDDALPSHDFARMLPYEIALQVFEYLEAEDILSAERVSKAWYNLASETPVWRTVFLRKYQRRVYTDPAPIQVGGLGCGRPNRPNQEWRKMYKARVQLEQNWRAGATDAGKAVYLSGHTDSVYCLQFDEDKIITGSRDRTIRVWDINTFQCLRVIGGPTVRPVLGPKVLRTVDYPSFHLATASVNGTAYGDSIYHVPTEWHDASILCLQYDDEILVTGSSDSDLLVWDIKTYQPIKRLRKHTGGVLDVALDAKHIVSCSKDSRIIVWDRKTFEPKGDLTGHRGPVNAVQLRGHLLVSASGDGIARLWDLNQMKLIKEFSAKERGLAAVEFSEDMKYVLAGGNDNITYKFETETGREVLQFTGHTQLVRSLWLDSANSRVVSGSYDLDLRVYDFTSGRELWRGEEWTTSWMLAAKSDYRRIVATSQDGRILIVDFGILKGAPTYKSRDGSPIDHIDLLRGTDHTNAIQFRNPFESTRARDARAAAAAAAATATAAASNTPAAMAATAAGASMP